MIDLIVTGFTYTVLGWLLLQFIRWVEAFSDAQRKNLK